MADAEQMIPLLGRQADDPAVEQLFVDLQTLRRPELDPRDGDAITDFVQIRRQGLELGFVDKVYYEAGPRAKRRGRCAILVMYQVYFYTQRENISTFRGRLPFELDWSDNRESARQKLEAFETTRRSYTRDAWTLPSFHLILEYKGPHGQLDNVLCQIPMHPWPEKGRVQPSLSVEDWLSLFGLPLSSPTLIDRLRPLDVAKSANGAADTHEIDFRYECGLQLTFTRAKNLRLKNRSLLTRSVDPVLGMVTFLRSRENDAREWSGELPLRLSFDDTPVSSVEKVGRSPDQQEDEELMGFALWHLDEYDLHVQYSTVENHLTEVSLMAPGYWS